MAKSFEEIINEGSVEGLEPKVPNNKAVTKMLEIEDSDIKQKILHIRVTKDLYEKLSDIAAANNLKVSTMINGVLRRFVKENY